MNKQAIIIALATLLLMACSSDSLSPVGEERAALVITSGIGVATVGMTRTSGVSWSDGDQIGVFATPAGNTAQTITGGANVAYSTTVTSATTSGSAESYTYTPAAFTASTPVYLPADGSAIQVYAYYPYSSTVTNATQIPITVTDQSSQSAIDFMRAWNDKTTLGGSTAITKVNKTTQLLFYHKLSKVVFTLVAGTGMAAIDLTGSTSTTLTIGGQPTAATYNIYTDAITITPGSSTITALTVTPGVQYEAILLPNTTGDGGTNNPSVRNCTLAIGSATYTFSIPAAKSFDAGIQTNYTLTVNSNGLDVKAAIEPWATGQTVSLTAQ